MFVISVISLCDVVASRARPVAPCGQLLFDWREPRTKRVVRWEGGHASFVREVPTPSVFESQSNITFKPGILTHHIPDLPTTPNLPTKNLPAKIRWLRLSRKIQMDMRILHLKCKCMIESNLPKSRILVRRLAVLRWRAPSSGCCLTWLQNMSAYSAGHIVIAIYSTARWFKNK